MRQHQTKWLVGLCVHQLKTAIGFHMKRLESTNAFYLKTVLRLKKNNILNLYLETRIANTSTVCLIFFIFRCFFIIHFIWFGGKITVSHLSILLYSQTSCYYWNIFEHIWKWPSFRSYWYSQWRYWVQWIGKGSLPNSRRCWWISWWKANDLWRL